MDETTTGVVGIGLIGIIGLGAVVYGDPSKITEITAFGTAVAGLIAALVRGGVGGGGSSNGG